MARSLDTRVGNPLLATETGIVDNRAMVEQQKAVFADLVSLLQQPSLEGIVAAAVDHLAVQSPLVTRDRPTTPGTTLVGTVLDGYASNQLEIVKKGFDLALEYGVIQEGQVDQLVTDPSPVVAPLKQLLQNINKPVPVPIGEEEFPDAVRSIEQERETIPVDNPSVPTPN